MFKVGCKLFESLCSCSGRHAFVRLMGRRVQDGKMVLVWKHWVFDFVYMSCYQDGNAKSCQPDDHLNDLRYL